MEARATLFALEKAGNSPTEWEDGAGFDGGVPASGDNPRFVVVDGATEAYDSLRWTSQLVTAFLGEESPAFALGDPRERRQAMHHWFMRMQQGWVDQTPVFRNVIEEYKSTREGSMATLLGCELADLAGRAPAWHAVAFGDTVLFQVRDGVLLKQFPPLRAEDFGLTPLGVRTLPSALEQMAEGMLFDSGELRVGDLLFLATDAFAHWMVQRNAQHSQLLWTALSLIDHDQLFVQLVTEARAAEEMKNDDVTLLRVQVAATQPDYLVVCL